MPIENNLALLYQERFKSSPPESRNKIWKVLCHHFFQQFVRGDMHVLDLGAGYCEFINHIRCRLKSAVDLNEQFLQFADTDVTCYVSSVTDLSCMEKHSVDVVFMSNLLEHLSSKDAILQTFDQIRRLLKPGGKVMILQPNIRYLSKTYWDFFDHHIPLSDRSVVEALRMAGFDIQIIVPKFLPYTTKSLLPQHPALIKFYLRIRPAWKILGRQMFILAMKP